MQHRPVQDVLGRVVRAVVAAPARDAAQVAALVEVAGEERLAGLALGLEQLALREGPSAGVASASRRARRRRGRFGARAHLSVERSGVVSGRIRGLARRGHQGAAMTRPNMLVMMTDEQKATAIPDSPDSASRRRPRAAGRAAAFASTSAIRRIRSACRPGSRSRPGATRTSRRSHERDSDAARRANFARHPAATPGTRMALFGKNHCFPPARRPGCSTTATSSAHAGPDPEERLDPNEAEVSRWIRDPGGQRRPGASARPLARPASIPTRPSTARRPCSSARRSSSSSSERRRARHSAPGSRSRTRTGRCSARSRTPRCIRRRASRCRRGGTDDLDGEDGAGAGLRGHVGYDELSEATDPLAGRDLLRA